MDRAWIIGAATVAAALAACGDESDPIRLHLSWRTEGSLACPADTCSALELHCDAMVSVRVVDASDSSKVYVDRCLPLAAAPDLCGLRDLPLASDDRIPHRAVRVEVSIWPRAQIGDECPTTVEYDVRGLPQSRAMQPAIGGAQLVLAGQAPQVEVALACPNALALTDEACLADQPRRVTGTIEDFARRSSVPASIAEYLIVSAGPPVERIVQGSDTSQWELRPADLELLEPDATSSIAPLWTGSVPRELTDTICLEALHRTEGGPTATCRAVPTTARALDLHGAYVPPTLRKDILAALGLDTVPPEGLVLGRVVDGNGAPIEGIKVVPSPMASTVYIDGTGNHIDAASTETSPSGMWVSIDAAPRTLWSVDGPLPSPVTPSAIGGRIAGHLTIVELVIGAPAMQLQADADTIDVE
jgi:hypothetical protein